MKTRNRGRILAIGALLGLGLLVAYLRPVPGPGLTRGLGELLWHNRRVDLIIQLGLMLVGAFGIRALLPSAEEEENPGDESFG